MAPYLTTIGLVAFALSGCFWLASRFIDMQNAKIDLERVKIQFETERLNYRVAEMSLIEQQKAIEHCEEHLQG